MESFFGNNSIKEICAPWGIYISKWHWGRVVHAHRHVWYLVYNGECQGCGEKIPKQIEIMGEIYAKIR